MQHLLTVQFCGLERQRARLVLLAGPILESKGLGAIFHEKGQNI